jgi:hypothetical protein
VGSGIGRERPLLRAPAAGAVGQGKAGRSSGTRTTAQSGNQGQLSSVQRRVGSAPGSNIAQTTRINCAAPCVLAATLTQVADNGVSLIFQSQAVVVRCIKLRAGGAGRPRRSRGCLVYCGFTKAPHYLECLVKQVLDLLQPCFLLAGVLTHGGARLQLHAELGTVARWRARAANPKAACWRGAVPQCDGRATQRTPCDRSAGY